MKSFKMSSLLFDWLNSVLAAVTAPFRKKSAPPQACVQ